MQKCSFALSVLLLTVVRGSSPAIPIPIQFVAITRRYTRSISAEVLNPVWGVALEDSNRRYPQLLHYASWSMEVIDDTLADTGSSYPVLLSLGKVFHEKLDFDSLTIIFAPGTVESAVKERFRTNLSFCIVVFDASHSDRSSNVSCR